MWRWWAIVATAGEQLQAHASRTLLAVLGIAIAVASTTLIATMIEGMSRYFDRALSSLGTNAVWVWPEYHTQSHVPPWRVQLTERDLDEVTQRCEGLERTAPLIVQKVDVRLGAETVESELRGSTAEYQEISNVRVAAGRCFGPVEVRNRRQVCVVGRDVLRDLSADEGIVGRHLWIADRRFLVVGVFERKGSYGGQRQDNLVLVPYTVALKMFPEIKRAVVIMGQLESPDRAEETRAQIISTLRRRHHLGPEQGNDFGIVLQDQIIEQFRWQQRRAAMFLFLVVGVSLLVAGIGVMNTMLVSVTERTREIGLRKALGARRRDILGQFLAEAVLQSVAGGIVGLTAALGLGWLLARHPLLYETTIPPWAIGLGMGIALAVGVVFGLLPAAKAALVQPIEALRYE